MTLFRRLSNCSTFIIMSWRYALETATIHTISMMSRFAPPSNRTKFLPFLKVSVNQVRIIRFISMAYLVLADTTPGDQP